MRFTIGQNQKEKDNEKKLKEKQAAELEASKAAASEKVSISAPASMDTSMEMKESVAAEESPSVVEDKVSSSSKLIDDNEVAEIKRRRRRRGGMNSGGSSAISNASDASVPLIDSTGGADIGSSFGETAYQLQLSQGLVGADRLLHALDRCEVRYTLVSYNVDGIGEDKPTSGTLVCLVQAQRVEVWRVLSSLNVTLGVAEEEEGDGTNSRIRITQINVTIP